MSILTLEPAIYAGEDVTGKTCGQYTVLGKTRVHFYPSGNSHHMWLVRCSCGAEFDLTEEDFKELCKMVTEYDQHSN